MERSERCIVIEFKRASNNFKRRVCPHRETVLEEEFQIVRCKQCGEMLTAYEFLKHCIRNETWLRDDIVSLRKQCEELTEKRDELKRQVGYLKRKATGRDDSAARM